jgi:class 3 adenylate cyclase/tetratricopeptide (TPR) repeat protein
MVRKTVTVLFADVAGSTSLGERLDPEALRRVLSRYYETARAILERHGGTVEKFIGDAVMAVFGIPAAREDDALRALRAAVELRDAGLDVDLRIGVNTGEVVADAGETLVTGDAVNVAARLEQSAQSGEVLIGEATYRLARDALRVDEVETLELKGKSDPVRAWRLLTVLDDAPAFTRRLDAPFVGRGDELAQLEAAFHRAASERSVRVVTVLGAGGIGKSRLVRELIGRAGERARVVVGRCLPYGDGITYWPLAEIVRQVAADSEGLQAAVGDPLVAERVAAVVGFGGSEGPTEETHWAARKLLEALTAERPLIAVFDDLHWAEPTFLDFLEYVAGFAVGAPILLVCTARSELLEARPSWTAPRANAETLVLAPLPEADSAELVEQLVPAGDLSHEDRVRIVAAAEGNPLFVEQLLALNEHADGGGLVIPPTIQALLAARIDSLADGERVVIDRGSVEGRLFHRRAVAELAPEDVRADVTSHLMTLVRKELVRPDRSYFPGDDGFRFGHILIRDAVYAAMPKELRAELHERLARWLEDAAGDRRLELEEIVGYHLEQAVVLRQEVGLPDEPGLRVEAGRRLGEAGTRAANRGDLPAARSLLERSVELLPAGDRLRVQLLARLGFILFTIAELAGARETLERAMSEADAAGARAAMLEARLRLRHLELQTDPDVDVDERSIELERLRPELDDLDDPRLRMAFLTVEFMVALMRNDVDASGRIAQAQVEAAREAGDVHAEGEAFFFVSARYWLGNDPVEEGYRACEALAAEATSPLHQLAVTNALAGLDGLAGDFERARARIREVRRGYRELGSLVIAAGTGLGEGMIELQAGDAEAAEAVLRDACDRLREMGETGYLSTAVAYLGEALYRLGRLDEAEAATKESERLAAAGDVASQTTLRTVRAKVLARRGSFAEAERLARAGVDFVAATDARMAIAEARRDLAEVLALAGKADEAAAELGRAIEVAEAKGATAVVADLRERLASLPSS